MKWIRLWIEETLTGTTFSELNAAQRGVWFSLLILAGRPPNEGRIELRKGVGYGLEHLAYDLQVEPDVLNDAILRLIEVGKVRTLPRHSPYTKANVRLTIAKWGQYQTEYAKYRKGKRNKGLGVGHTSGYISKGLSTTDLDQDSDQDQDLDTTIEKRDVTSLIQPKNPGKTLLIRDILAVTKDRVWAAYYKHVVYSLTDPVVRRILSAVKQARDMGEIRQSPGKLFKYLADKELEIVGKPWGKEK